MLITNYKQLIRSNKNIGQCNAEYFTCKCNTLI